MKPAPTPAEEGVMNRISYWSERFQKEQAALDSTQRQLRAACLDAHLNGWPYRKIAAYAGVSAITVRQWFKKDSK